MATHTQTRQLRSSAPPQYPLETFAEFGALENIHPFRYLWLELRERTLASIARESMTPIATCDVEARNQRTTNSATMTKAIMQLCTITNSTQND